MRLFLLFLLLILSVTTYAEVVPGSRHHLTLNVYEQVSKNLADQGRTYFINCNKLMKNDQDVIYYNGNKQKTNSLMATQPGNALSKVMCTITYAHIYNQATKNINWMIKEGKYNPENSLQLVKKATEMVAWILDDSDYLNKYDPTKLNCGFYVPKKRLYTPHHGPAVHFPISVTDCTSQPYGAIDVESIDGKLVTIEGIHGFSPELGHVLGEKFEVSF
jgi:hypothetical protein